MHKKCKKMHNKREKKFVNEEFENVKVCKKYIKNCVKKKLDL
jgi:hypothetical protein